LRPRKRTREAERRPARHARPRGHRGGTVLHPHHGVAGRHLRPAPTNAVHEGCAATPAVVDAPGFGHHLLPGDVKPEDILLHVERMPMATDFGIAKPPAGSIATVRVPLEKSNRVAPEQLAGHPVYPSTTSCPLASPTTSGATLHENTFTTAAPTVTLVNPKASSLMHVCWFDLWLPCPLDLSGGFPDRPRGDHLMPEAHAGPPGGEVWPWRRKEIRTRAMTRRPRAHGPARGSVYSPACRGP
jgi:serine/threonine protein kinase